MPLPLPLFGLVLDTIAIQQLSVISNLAICHELASSSLDMQTRSFLANKAKDYFLNYAST